MPEGPPVVLISGAGPQAGGDLYFKVIQAYALSRGAMFKTDRDAPYVSLINEPGIGGPRDASDLDPGSAKREKVLEPILKDPTDYSLKFFF